MHYKVWVWLFTRKLRDLRSFGNQTNARNLVVRLGVQRERIFLDLRYAKGMKLDESNRVRASETETGKRPDEILP